MYISINYIYSLCYIYLLLLSSLLTLTFDDMLKKLMLVIEKPSCFQNILLSVSPLIVN